MILSPSKTKARNKYNINIDTGSQTIKKAITSVMPIEINLGVKPKARGRAPLNIGHVQYDGTCRI